MYQPPLTLIVWPVIEPLVANIATTLATSSTVPNRPTGIKAGVARGLSRIMSVSGHQVRELSRVCAAVGVIRGQVEGKPDQVELHRPAVFGIGGRRDRRQ